MKTKKKNINLKELFRDQLEFAEVTPGVEVKSVLMRRVARKEFMRFNPAKFNIYYLAAILITGITAITFLFLTSKIPNRLNTDNISERLINQDSTGYIEVKVDQPIRIKTPKSDIIPVKTNKEGAFSGTRDNNAQKVLKAVEIPDISTYFPASVTDSITSNVLLSHDIASNQKLISGFKPNELLIDPYSSVGCAPFKLQFHSRSASNDSCRWSFGDGGYSNQRDPEWIFDVAGDYKVVLEIFNHDGKILSSVATVTVYPRPQAHFEISPDKAVQPINEIHFLNYSTNAVRFKWDFGDGFTSESVEPWHAYARLSNYNVRLIAFSDWGCSDSLTILNAFSGSGYFIDFPNAFIPNAQGPSGGFYSSKSDEGAQVFHPSFSGISDYHLKIFSKLGIMIFESNDINLGWDGYIKGQLSEPGVYIWKVRGKFRNGEPFIKMGDVTLLKN